jgi:integral membrane sensor domain MASE1
LILWWIGNAVLVFVVIPVVLLFLNRVLRPTLEIRRYVHDVLEHGVALSGTFDCIPMLTTTCELAISCRLNVTRYGLALARLYEADAADQRAGV